MTFSFRLRIIVGQFAGNICQNLWRCTPPVLFIKKHFSKEYIAPENSPAKFLAPKSFRGFLRNEHQLIHGSSTVSLAYLCILQAWSDSDENLQ